MNRLHCLAYNIPPIVPCYNNTYDFYCRFLCVCLSYFNYLRPLSVVGKCVTVPPNRRVDFYCRFLPAKLTSRFLLPISSRQIDKSIPIADF
jgi:hypothetical protein